MFAWLGRILGGIFTFKTFLSVIFMTILGVIFYNLACDVIEEILNFAVSHISGSPSGVVTNPTFSGFAGWVISNLKIPECVAIMVTCVSIRFVLTKIPFLHW
jgi:hypothetical protein